LDEAVGRAVAASLFVSRCTAFFVCGRGGREVYKTAEKKQVFEMHLELARLKVKTRDISTV